MFIFLYLDFWSYVLITLYLDYRTILLSSATICWFFIPLRVTANTMCFHFWRVKIIYLRNQALTSRTVNVISTLQLEKGKQNPYLGIIEVKLILYRDFFSFDVWSLLSCVVEEWMKFLSTRLWRLAHAAAAALVTTAQVVRYTFFLCIFWHFYDLVVLPFSWFQLLSVSVSSFYILLVRNIHQTE